MIEQEENIKYIQSQLGHSSPTVTLNVYAHLMKPVNQEAACKLENMVFSEDGDQMETKEGRVEKNPLKRGLFKVTSSKHIAILAFCMVGGKGFEPLTSTV